MPTAIRIISLPGFIDLAPTAMPGRLLASQPKRGDVIVFKLPRDGETDYIKRLIGLPGDRIQMKADRLYINDQIVERQPLPPYHDDRAFRRGRPGAHYHETLPGGVKHEIIQLEGDNNPMPYTANTDVYVVPPGEYFFMGDNRDNSSDSRVPPDRGGVGYVPFENLIGRAEMIFFSVDDAPAWEFWRWPWTVRWNRLFHAVH